MLKKDHQRIVRQLKQKHHTEVQRLDRIISQMADDLTFLREQLAECQQALQDTTQELAAATLHEPA